MVDKPKTLPETRSSDFWGDAEIIRPDMEVKELGKTHSWKQEGPYAICTSCMISHALFIDLREQEVREGKIVSKLKPVVKTKKRQKNT